MYYLAKNYHEGWSLEPYEDLELLKKDILNGSTYGQEFKVLKELDLKIIDKEQSK